MPRFLVGLICWLMLVIAFTPQVEAATEYHSFPVVVGERSLTQTQFHEILRTNSFRLKPDALGTTLAGLGFQPQLGQLNLTKRTTQAELEAIAERAIHLDTLLDAVALTQTSRLSRHDINQAFAAYRGGDYSVLERVITRWQSELATQPTPEMASASPLPAATEGPIKAQPTPTEIDNAFLRQALWASLFSFMVLLIFAIWLLMVNAALKNQSQIPKLRKQIQTMIEHEERLKQRNEKLEAKIQELIAENQQHLNTIETHRNRATVARIDVPQTESDPLPLQAKLDGLISDCSKNLEHHSK